MRIREAKWEELDQIEAIYAYARQFQREHGNPKQWGSGYPFRDQLEEDIQKKRLYVICREETDVPAGVFMFMTEPEPSYSEIRQGAWLNNLPYGTIHRLASDGSCRGVGKACFDWAFARCGNIKIDTHEDNTVMQSLLKRQGFVRCGIVTIENGEERIAFQKCRL